MNKKRKEKKKLADGGPIETFVFFAHLYGIFFVLVGFVSPSAATSSGQQQQRPTAVVPSQLIRNRWGFGATDDGESVLEAPPATIHPSDGNRSVSPNKDHRKGSIKAFRKGARLPLEGTFSVNHDLIKVRITGRQQQP